MHEMHQSHHISFHPDKVDFDENPYIVVWEVTRARQLKCLPCSADAQDKPDPMELFPIEHN